jgi:general secretion pathway protein D
MNFSGSIIRYSTIVAMCAPTICQGISIAEKRTQLESSENSSRESEEFRSIQDALEMKKQALKELYFVFQKQFNAQDSSKSPEERLKASEPLRKKIVGIRGEIASLEQEWGKIATGSLQEDFEGLWHQPDTTIGQLIIDYNVGDVVYVMPPEIAGMKIHVSSRLPVPKACWEEMLNVVLAGAGIGVKELSPFVRQLHFLRVNQSNLSCITDSREVLTSVSANDKVAFICSPPAGDVRRVFQFLEKFAPQEQMAVQLVGGHLVIVGLAREVIDILKIYDFIVSPRCLQEHRIVALQRADSEEMAKILTSIFEGDGSKMPESSGGDKAPVFFPSDPSFGFRVIALKYPASSLFLMGKQEQLQKACDIIQEVEQSIGEVQEKTIHWYACRHSEADELAKVLSQVYIKLMNIHDAEHHTTEQPPAKKRDALEKMQEKIKAREQAQDALIVESPQVSLAPSTKEQKGTISENFIVDQKTNSIIMVVETYILPKLKDLLRKLDVPKRMVQIDVLLFEKKIADASSIGLSKLRMSDAASKKSQEGVEWDASLRQGKKSRKHKRGEGNGILEFFFSRGKAGWFPAYDLAYQFLISQEDIQINASPSVTAVNQTQAKIAVVDQISINTGAVEFDREHVKDSYSRAEYGITIQITPTIHAKSEEVSQDEPKYVTLVTDVIFDSTRPDKNDRPDVTRRNIKNEVSVRDGETAILGGLRRKLSSGGQHIIPFLGELPGIGKLFGSSNLADSNTEMFIFLTPRILPDDREEWKKIRLQELSKRPGDLPEFLEEVQEARQSQKWSIMEKSLRMLLGKPDATSG